MTTLTKQIKSVSFAAGTNFGSSRSKDEYRRSHRSYISGIHCCPDEAGWKDTSLMSDFAFQLDQHKVFDYFLANNGLNADVHKRSLELQMRAYRPLPCISTSAWTAVETHSARAHLFEELTKVLDNPECASSRVFIFSVTHADGLVLWKETGSDEFMTYQWITDTYTDLEATSFCLI